MTERSRDVAWIALGVAFAGAAIAAWDLGSWLPFAWPLSYVVLFLYLGREE